LFNLNKTIVSVISEKANELLKSISLTSDDEKRFEPRGSFAMQVEDSIGESMCLVDTNIRDVNGKNGKLQFTVLNLAQESNEKRRANCTVAYDFQNVFLTSDPETSLHKLGEGNQGELALQHMGYFVVDKVVPTGIYPMKYSKAAQAVGLPLGKELTDADWVMLRAKYKSSDEMKAMREDNTGDISWLEIKHVFISPRS
jgi:hypothetical protein